MKRRLVALEEALRRQQSTVLEPYHFSPSQPQDALSSSFLANRMEGCSHFPAASPSSALGPETYPNTGQYARRSTLPGSVVDTAMGSAMSLFLDMTTTGATSDFLYQTPPHTTPGASSDTDHTQGAEPLPFDLGCTAPETAPSQSRKTVPDPLPRLTTPRGSHECQMSSGDAPIELKIERILEVIQSAGFKNFDTFATAYYTSTLPSHSPASAAQRVSRTRNMRHLLEGLRSSVSTWSRFEAHEYYVETSQSAESLYSTELGKLIENERRDVDSGRPTSADDSSSSSREQSHLPSIEDLKWQDKVRRARTALPPPLSFINAYGQHTRALTCHPLFRTLY